MCSIVIVMFNRAQYAQLLVTLSVARSEVSSSQDGQLHVQVATVSITWLNPVRTMFKCHTVYRTQHFQLYV